MSGSMSLVLPHSPIAICLFDPEQTLQRHSSTHKMCQDHLLCLQSLQKIAHVTFKGYLWMFYNSQAQTAWAQDLQCVHFNTI